MALRGVVLLCVLPLLPGCVTPWEKSALLKDSTPNIARVQGPTERRLRNLMWLRDQEDSADSDSLKPLVGTEDYVAATDIYKDERFAEAQQAFKKVAKKYKKSDIREDALFMQAEAAYQQDHYAKAHDVYAVLLKEFPSTRHLDVVSERLFKIGRIWLDFPEVAKLGEVQQVNYDDPKHKLPAEEPAKKSSGKPIFVPNFTDKAEPLFDTAGNGVAALQAIWMNDPTGPLADDAMMLVASHHARKGNFVEADRFFQMLRETFPNSPHLQEAFLLGSHVKLMSYQGAEYEGKTLNEAKLLKQSTLRLYPDIADKERLKQELTQIDEATAEREWKQVELWLRKGNKRAATVYCHQVIDRYPHSSNAQKAREKLEALGPEYASGAVLLQPTDPKKTPLWARVIPQSQPKPSMARPAPAKSPYAPNPAAEESPSRWLTNPFNRSPKVEGPSSDENSEEMEVRDDDTETNDSAKKRGWFRWSPPRRLPADADTDAKEIEPAAAGRTKL